MLNVHEWDMDDVDEFNDLKDDHDKDAGEFYNCAEIEANVT